MIDSYDDFMTGVLEQLYMNREKHQKHAARDIDYMFKIGAEQFGQLGKALSDEDWEKAEIEVYHTAAILFEIHHRLKGKNDGHGNHDSNGNGNSELLGGDYPAAH